MPATLDAIVNLQTTLNELAAANQRLHSIPDWMQELHEEHSGRQAEIDAVAEAAEAADRERREAEAATTDAEERLKHYQQQISRVSTQREYGALLKEIDTVKGLIRDAEQKALEALEKNEESLKQLEEQREAFRDLDGRYQAELAKWESEKPAVAAAIDELKQRCKELRDQVPRPVLTLFDRIYERYDGQALSRVRQLEAIRGNTMWHCEACSFNVRPQIVVEIKTGGRLNHCDSCKRILYWDEEG